MNAANICLLTVATRNRLAQAGVLADSLARAHPGARLTVYLVERDVRPNDGYDGRIETRCAADLPLPGGERFLFQYTPFELCCALKPFVMADALARPATAAAIYLDSDMLALDAFLEPVMAAWQQGEILLTPHLRRPWIVTDYHLLLKKEGMFNAGFVACRRGADTDRFLQWWMDRLARDCVNDPLRGLWVDQRWLDIAGLFPGVVRLAHPGINTGPFNLHECALRRHGAAVAVDDAHALLLLHFCGFDPVRFSRHRPDDPPDPVAASLAAAYAQALARLRPRFPTDAPYSFAAFHDGQPITPAMREALRSGLIDTAAPFADARRFRDAERLPLPRRPGAVAQLEHRLVAAETLIDRLWRHPVIGRLWRGWRRWINPRLAPGT